MVRGTLSLLQRITINSKGYSALRCASDQSISATNTAGARLVVARINDLHRTRLVLDVYALD